jgi:hypothetical protein
MPDVQIFGLERLEDRLLLAVNIKQSGAKLTITGDDLDNLVALYDEAGGIRVLVDEDGDGTIDLDAIYYGVENIKVSLKGGNDEVFVAGITIEQGLTIDTGSGDDLVVFTDYFYLNEIDGSVSITSGDGDDDVLVAGVEITGNLTINTGNGEDYVAVGDDAPYSSDIYFFAGETEGYTEVRGNTVINTGNHDDEVNIQPDDGETYVEFRGHLTVNTGAGDDEVYIGGEGADADLHVHGNFSVQLGAGDDYVEIDNEDYYTRFYGKVVINGGGGFDSLYDLNEWFDDPGETFAGGIGAIKFVRIEEFIND